MDRQLAEYFRLPDDPRFSFDLTAHNRGDSFATNLIFGSSTIGNQAAKGDYVQKQVRKLRAFK